MLRSNRQVCHWPYVKTTRCDFFLQVSADNSTEETDHIEMSGDVSMHSAMIFFSVCLCRKRKTCSRNIAETYYVNGGSKTDRSRAW